METRREQRGHSAQLYITRLWLAVSLDPHITEQNDRPTEYQNAIPAIVTAHYNVVVIRHLAPVPAAPFCGGRFVPPTRDQRKNEEEMTEGREGLWSRNNMVSYVANLASTREGREEKLKTDIQLHAH